jgi:hypothetical protein
MIDSHKIMKLKTASLYVLHIHLLCYKYLYIALLSNVENVLEFILHLSSWGPSLVQNPVNSLFCNAHG